MLLKRWSVRERRHSLCNADAISDWVVRYLSGFDKIDRDREHSFILGADLKNRPLYLELLSIGIADATLVSCREVFRRAIVEGAMHLFFVHTHPSGDPEPSKQDEYITGKLVKSGNLLGVRVMDSIIVSLSTRQCYSFVREDPGMFSKLNLY